MRIKCPYPGCGFIPVDASKRTSAAFAQILEAHGKLHMSEVCPIVQLSCIHPECKCTFITDKMESYLAAVVMNDHYESLPTQPIPED